MSAVAVRAVACSDCGRSFRPGKPWWRFCPACAPLVVRRTSAVTSAGCSQLSLADTPEWVAATSPNVVTLRSRRPR